MPHKENIVMEDKVAGCDLNTDLVNTSSSPQTSAWLWFVCPRWFAPRCSHRTRRLRERITKWNTSVRSDISSFLTSPSNDPGSGQRQKRTKRLHIEIDCRYSNQITWSSSRQESNFLPHSVYIWSIRGRAHTLTSQLCDEGDHVVLLEDLFQFRLHVLVHVGFECVLEQDPPCSQAVVQPVRHVEHHTACKTPTTHKNCDP